MKKLFLSLSALVLFIACSSQSPNNTDNVTNNNGNVREKIRKADLKYYIDNDIDGDLLFVKQEAEYQFQRADSEPLNRVQLYVQLEEDNGTEYLFQLTSHPVDGLKYKTGDTAWKVGDITYKQIKVLNKRFKELGLDKCDKYLAELRKTLYPFIKHNYEIWKKHSGKIDKYNYVRDNFADYDAEEMYRERNESGIDVGRRAFSNLVMLEDKIYDDNVLDDFFKKHGLLFYYISVLPIDDYRHPDLNNKSISYISYFCKD